VESQGRGGLSRAKEKFGVSYLALKRWMSPKPKLKKRGRPKTEKTSRPATIKGLKGILGLVRKTEANFAAIKARLTKLGT